jgi:hypothetical protein
MTRLATTKPGSHAAGGKLPRGDDPGVGRAGATATPAILIAVPSKGRPGRVRTQKVFPSCKVYVPALEAPAYRRAGARHVVAVPDTVRGITATRNWILRSTKCRRVVMIDDDPTIQGYIKFFLRNTMKIALDEAQWLGEFRKIFEVTEQLNYRIWGVNNGATRAFYPFFPFRFRSHVTGSCMGIVNDGRTYFDESFPVKEDYELCARCIKEDGGIVSAQYLIWVNEHWDTPGGCTDYRTHSIERDCIRRLLSAYPGIVRASHRMGHGYSVEIAA